MINHISRVEIVSHVIYPIIHNSIQTFTKAVYQFTIKSKEVFSETILIRD